MSMFPQLNCLVTSYSISHRVVIVFFVANLSYQRIFIGVYSKNSFYKSSLPPIPLFPHITLIIIVQDLGDF